MKMNYSAQHCHTNPEYLGQGDGVERELLCSTFMCAGTITSYDAHSAASAGFGVARRFSAVFLSPSRHHVVFRRRADVDPDRCRLCDDPGGAGPRHRRVNGRVDPIAASVAGDGYPDGCKAPATPRRRQQPTGASRGTLSPMLRSLRQLR
eukprot:s1128_g19.t1